LCELWSIRRLLVSAKAVGFWLFGGAAVLDVPGAHMMGVDLPKVPKVYEAHRAGRSPYWRSASG
jgi:hypothetical protein